MKTKLANMLRGKERRERKNRYEVDEEDLYTLKINCKEKRTAKEGIKQKKYNRFKKFKKKREKKRGKLHRTAKAQHRGRGL